MINPCRIGFLIGTCPPSFSNFSTDEDEFEETDGSAVYGHTLLIQRPSTVEWTPNLVSLVSFISTVDWYPIILRNMGGDFVCYTLLYARNPHDSNRWFRIQVETWDDMAKLCFQHLKPNDHTYVSGHLESYFKVSSKGNPKSSYKEESELKPVETLPEESESGTCQKFKEPESGACQKSMEPHSGAEIGMGKDKTHLCLWKALFSSLLGWWDNKKNRSYPTLSTRLVVMHFS
ncbi:hypothetical protein POPTR_002G129166v4 [Populus trichocarpa]|uniref:Uncharacterized protein n=1 Tax=Populus trichocarpa TaxID=3694 RepID=A0ACC0TE32_POPTR|nr:hypothetical protein BDE02_02G119100 [Populus trichocarpa]KAI9399663.1 hypothetical protein POPTR_002G129166v4 [Populus trichocarpa]